MARRCCRRLPLRAAAAAAAAVRAAAVAVLLLPAKVSRGSGRAAVPIGSAHALRLIGWSPRAPCPRVPGRARGALSSAPPGSPHCGPGAPCFPGEWRCDGHPDCDDGEDEWGCETATSAEPSPGVPEASATPEPELCVPSKSQGYTWILIVAGLLSILVAAGSVAVWVLSKAKSISNTFSLEKASREQLMPDKSQTGSSP
uniref:Uncharacterized protein n=1 Tax=Malurus cyaneus samueli TaxID=2593467 RepID=A0A8C5X7G1_9PASS